MEDAQYAITMPGSHLWGQTFMKRHENVSIGGQGDYTYTSEMTKNTTQNITELMGYFHLSNQHNGSEDRNQWEKVTLRNTLLGRDVWHCKESFIFAPWSVLERHPIVSGPQDIYLMYACGPDFIL